MAVYSFNDAEIYYGDVNLTGYANSVNLEATADPLDATVFGNTYRTRAAGLKSFTSSISGLQDNAAADPEEHLSTQLGSTAPLSIMPQDGDTFGDHVFFGLVREFQYQTGASVGELHTFTVSAEGTDGIGLARGDVMAIKQARTSTADGGAVQFGTVAAGEYACAALHCFSGSGGTLDVTIKSDSSGLFPSPSTRLTFAQLSGPGSEFVSVGGAIADDYWRASWTISAGTFTFAVLFGIAS